MRRRAIHLWLVFALFGCVEDTIEAHTDSGGSGSMDPIGGTGPDPGSTGPDPASTSSSEGSDLPEAESGEPVEPHPCELPIAEGVECPEVGLRCPLDDAFSELFCSAEGRWTRRDFVPPETSEVDVPVPDDVPLPADTVECSGFAADECGELAQCEFGCSRAVDGFRGCVGGCNPRVCDGIPVSDCPASRCQIMIDCAGQPVCASRFHGEPPACGVVGYYGQDAPCCQGLSRRCGAAADGHCDESRSPIKNMAVCVACGDGVCEPTLETSCSCPEDCG